MQPTDYTISPTEIKVLLDYTQLLKDDAYYREDRQSNETNPLPLNVARELIQFHIKKAGTAQESFNFDGRHINLNYLKEEAQHNHGLKVMLRDRSELMIHLAESYLKSLELNGRHHVLNKTIAEMTGYDLQKLAMYILQDIQANQQSGQSPTQ